MTLIREIERPVRTLSRYPRTPRKAGTFGDRLTRRRLELGLTQREVAELAGMNAGSVRQLERGRVNGGPTAYTLAALARVLGVTMGCLWGLEAQP